MQHVEKKKRGKSRVWLRWALLGLLLTALAAALLVMKLLDRPMDLSSLESPDTYGELLSYEASEVSQLTVAIPGEAPWTLVQRNGAVTLVDEPDAPLDNRMIDNLLEAARVVSYSDVLSDDPADYADRLDEFGLDQATVVDIAYQDGRSVTLRIGSRSDEIDTAFYYMLVGGDDRLFALDVPTANTLCSERYLLRDVVQPVIHKARIDAVTIELPTGVIAWQLNGSIEDADAADRWLLVSPARYPADGESMANLRENLSNLRLGAYVCPVTDEQLTAYGFDAPRMVLTIHQGAGAIGTVSQDGIYGMTNWPESTEVITVGAAKNDSVDYVRFGDSIYITSHFTLQTLMGMQPQSTLTRYPVLVSLSNLHELWIEADGEPMHFILEQVESIGENEELVTTYEARLNGSAINYEAFEAAYNRLLIATVSGALPSGWTQTEPVHTRYTFVTRTGVTHTLALTPFDALHDAVLVDNCAMFYIIRGGLDFVFDEQ